MELYPKLPRTLLVKLSTVNDDECEGLTEIMGDFDDESPYESMMMPRLTPSSSLIRTPSPSCDRVISPAPSASSLPSSSYVSSDVEPWSYSLPSLSDLFEPRPPDSDENHAEIICTGSREPEPTPLDVDIKPKVRFSYFFDIYWSKLTYYIFRFLPVCGGLMTMLC